MPTPVDRTTLGFFTCLSNLYYVFAPDYRTNAAGIRALHYLCHALNESGHEAYVYPATVLNPYLRTPRLQPEIVLNHYATGRTPIAVYPEVVPGNPMHAPLVARWLLNKPGHLGGDKAYAKNETIFYFDPWVVKDTDLRAWHLKVPLVDRRVFNNENNPDDHRRRGACYYAHKFLAAGGKVRDEHRNGAVSLCQDQFIGPEEIAAILRRSEVLYCYEQSSIIAESLYCGCPVVIVPTDYWRNSQNPDGQLPLGVGLEDEVGVLARLKGEIRKAVEQQEDFHRVCWDSVNAFVQITGSVAEYFQQEYSRMQRDAICHDKPNIYALWSVPASLRKQYLPLLEKVFPTFRDPWPIGPERGPRYTQGSLTPQELTLFGQRVPLWSAQPFFHVVIVDDEVSDAGLASTLESLTKQQYGRVIATVVSTHHAAPANLGKGALEWWQTPGDPRILANEVIAKSPADWCGIMRAGDILMPHAFLAFGEFLNTHPSCMALYSDETATDGARDIPDLRPDFDVDRLRANGYIQGLLLAKRESWSAIGGWLALPDGLDELDAALRLAEACGKDGFGHVPGILYCRNATARRPSPGGASQELRRQIVQEHLARQRVAAVAEDGLLPGTVRVRHALEQPPLVSVIIPTKNRAAALEACLASLVETTQYPELEILVVDNGSDDPAARAYSDGLAQLGEERLRVLRNEEAFNLAKLVNMAAAEATGELLLLLHDDVSAVHPDWLHNMASLCARPEVAAVGARLLRRDGTLQQAWLAPIKAGLVPPPFQGWSLDAPDSQRHLNVEQGVSAVGAACMLVKKSAFLEVGGMDAGSFPAYFADIDLCLKLRAAGRKILWTPYATLVHDSDSSTWGDKSANEALVRKWGKVLAHDPFLNPYVAVGGSGLEPETDPVFLPDVITWHPVPNVLALACDLDGSGHYRVVHPARGAMEASLARSRVSRGYPTVALMEKFEVDTVYSQRQLEDRQIENLKRYREVLGCRIVMDFDDLVTHVPEKNAHKKSLFKDMKNRLRQIAAVADRLTVSTAPLADHFAEYHGDIRVVPNALMRSQWEHLASRRNTSKKCRVGWAGGISHRGDLEVVRDAIRDLADEVEWVFLGMQLEDCVRYVKEFHKGVAFPAYAEKLASLNLDLAIAPLEIHPFNECKSHLRLLEYGILGIPVIATDIHPYRSGFPVTLVKNKHKDWVRAIRDHISDRDAMYRKGDELRQHILDRWMLDQHLAEWLAAWS
jgi:GT2 family glycosyltransferase